MDAAALPYAETAHGKQSMATDEQIGRDLRAVYPASENLPPQLRALADELERKIMAHRNRSPAEAGQTG